MPKRGDDTGAGRSGQRERLGYVPPGSRVPGCIRPWTSVGSIRMRPVTSTGPRRRAEGRPPRRPGDRAPTPLSATALAGQQAPAGQRRDDRTVPLGATDLGDASGRRAADGRLSVRYWTFSAPLTSRPSPWSRAQLSELRGGRVGAGARRASTVTPAAAPRTITTTAASTRRRRPRPARCPVRRPVGRRGDRWVDAGRWCCVVRHTAVCVMRRSFRNELPDLGVLVGPTDRIAGRRGAVSRSPVTRMPH